MTATSPLVVSGAGVAHDRTVDAHVLTTQIAPSILVLLDLNPHDLQAVRIEHTEVLPSLRQVIRPTAGGRADAKLVAPDRAQSPNGGDLDFDAYGISSRTCCTFGTVSLGLTL